MKLAEQDPWLLPFENQIQERILHTRNKIAELTQTSTGSLSDFAVGHHYYGLHQTSQGWLLREMLPNAHDVYLIGDFNAWEKKEEWKLKCINQAGDWEIRIDTSRIHHGDKYKLFVKWDGGYGERIPAYARYVVQDAATCIFSAQVWAPEKPFTFKHNRIPPLEEPLLIYECHIGMSGEAERVHTYNEFRLQVLPRIVKAGYNAIQIMGIQEHPYYGSFGYHVSNFFAPSSRFGTPDELKELIDDAHGMGLRVIMDLVHSHAAKNEIEGPGCYDGTRTLFFHEGNRGLHPSWDSLCFNYGRTNVMLFLLSNCKYWMEEFGMDGFRFDGVSSMIYFDHGLNRHFNNYADYFNGNADLDALSYLTIANELIHQINPDAITIAEEVSGMPGIATTTQNGGIGFNYRMAMNIPDFWIKLIKEQADEYWTPEEIWHQLTNRRSEEKTISYAESHDQALVGDKTLIFRLIDSDMYWHMAKDKHSYRVDRGMALIKLIKLATLSTINGGFLNFMGNEFGHPEWIDFPRQGNDWSYLYARRQWHLVDDPFLRYGQLAEFDHDIINMTKTVYPHFEQLLLRLLVVHNENQILCFERGSLLFVFNFHPDKSYTDYPLSVSGGKYKVILNTDNIKYGGFGLSDDSVEHFTIPDYDDAGKLSGTHYLNIYIPSRTAQILLKVD